MGHRGAPAAPILGPPDPPSVISLPPTLLLLQNPSAVLTAGRGVGGISPPPVTIEIPGRDRNPLPRPRPASRS